MENATSTSATEGQSSLTPEGLAAIHLAEYAALTNRCTYWIAIQAGFLPVLAGIIGLGAERWFGTTSPITKGAILWTSLFLFQIVAAALQKMVFEQYVATTYLETVLRPAMEKLCPSESRILCYESFLQERRGKSRIPGTWWECILPVVIGPVTALIAWNQRPYYSFGNIFALVVNAGGFLFICLQTMRITKVHRPLVGW
ncbi:MAG: hypothetical protein JWM10_3061 [Myxococcaceae bacterium]|nr:hypothetical protein [Myxococcaceae bacterium]